MRRILLLVNLAFLLIMLSNYFYYRDLYKKQINYIFELLNRQVQIVGPSVDETNNSFVSDLNQINFDNDLTFFFKDPVRQRTAVDKIKLFYSKYQDFITGIKYYDTEKNEFSLKKDSESERGEWLESQPFVLHVQPEIFSRDTLLQEYRRFNYILPVFDKKIVGNLVVTVDFQKYFNAIFTTFNLQDYQWQWVLSENGEIIYNNYRGKGTIQYEDLSMITRRLSEGSVDYLTHHVIINGKTTKIISSFYPAQLLKRDIGLIFSASTVSFQREIIRNSIFIVLSTLLLVLVIILIFRKFIRQQQGEIRKLGASLNSLFSLIDEMPVGLMIYNRNRGVLKANLIAVNLYSWERESDVTGKIYPDNALPEGVRITYPDPESRLDPSQFFIIKKESGDIVVFRKSMPLIYQGEEATLEALIDVTLLDVVRKLEADKSDAKSELLARMSFEIRTPLNGIIGMTDILEKLENRPEVRDIINLLRSSSEVLFNMTNSVLDFSKIESGDMILDETPFLLRAEINYCAELARTDLDPQVELIIKIEENVPDSLVGDPYRLRQVISNLLNLSVKNTDSGKVQLRCSIAGNKDGVITLSFELLDTGKAYEKSALRKIFGDFTAEDNTRVTLLDSTFGTILAKRLIGLMGGELTAESPSGLEGRMGIRLSFTIRAYSNEREAKLIDTGIFTTFQSIKALAITGNQHRDEEALTAFNRTGVMVKVTTFTKVTVNQLKTNLNFPADRYSLIVIFDDPDFNGFDVAQIIHENDLSKYFIIILVSANDKKGNYMKTIALGIDHYLVKPFTDSDLKNIITGSFKGIGNQAVPIENNERKDIRILIVEDNKMNQVVIGTMLKNLGYRYDTADDGFAGLLQAKAIKYDLIFMDLIMPEMDGFEASRKILKTNESVLIVAFTADNMPETRKKAELSGINEFISKPVRIDELKKLLARYFTK